MHTYDIARKRIREQAKCLAGDLACKRTLLEKFKRIAVIEQEIVKVYHNLIKHAMTTALQKELTLYCAEKEVIAQELVKRDAGKISEQDFRQKTAGIEMRVDTVIRHVHKEVREDTQKLMKRRLAILQRIHENLMSSSHEAVHPLNPTLH